MSGRTEGELPWLAEAQRPPERLPDGLPALKPLLIDNRGNPIDSLDAWQARREEIRHWWQGFLGPLSTVRREVPSLEVLEEEYVAGVQRQLVRYEVEAGAFTEAYLLRPAGHCAAAPGVVVFHSTVDESIDEAAGVAGPSPKAFGLGLARRGYVALCPRNYLWRDGHTLSPRWQTGKLRWRHPRSKGMAKMLFDAIVAVDVLDHLPEVDSRRLGAVGHSLGAKEALYLAALDERIRVAAANEGGIGTRYSNWDAPWYLGRQIRRGTPDHEHHELLALVAPRAFLLLGGDGFDGAQSWPFIEAVLPVYRLYGAACRVGLYNHRQGHHLPPEAAERIYEWFEAYG
jgi:dienelactone hydrolase